MFADVSKEFSAPIFWIDEKGSSYQRMRRRISGACNLNQQGCENLKSRNSFFLVCHLQPVGNDMAVVEFVSFQ
jgi:hypothetical protein